MNEQAVASATPEQEAAILREQLRKANVENEQAQRVIADLENRINLTESNLRVCRAQLSETRTRETDSRVDVDVLKQRLTKTDALLDETQRRAEHLDTMVESASSTIEAQANTIEELRENIAGNQEKLVAVRKSKEAVTAELETLRKEHHNVIALTNRYFVKLWSALRRSDSTRPTVDKIINGKAEEPKRRR